jgi:hypothetical protein
MVFSRSNLVNHSDRLTNQAKLNDKEVTTAPHGEKSNKILIFQEIILDRENRFGSHFRISLIKSYTYVVFP